MHGDTTDLQPLPVERAAGLQSVDSDFAGGDAAVEPDSSVLELEKRHLLSSRGGTVSEGTPTIVS